MNVMIRERNMDQGRIIIPMDNYGLKEIISMENLMGYLRDITPMEIQCIREIILMENGMG
jgi:hypothetical protein